MNVTSWFREWLARHPLKEPLLHDRARYTAEVMASVKAAASPQREAVGLQWWFAWPRLALAAVTATAVILLIVMPRGPTSGRLAQTIEEELGLLSELDEEPLLFDETVGAPEEPDALADALEADDAWLLAEAIPSVEDEQWIEHTLQVLEALEEDVSEAGPADPIEDDQWLEELQWLDDLELTATS
jgi:hypothetical protein